MKIDFEYEGGTHLGFVSDRGLECTIWFDMHGDATVMSVDDLDIALNTDVAQKIHIVISGEIKTPIEIATYAEKMYSAIVAEYEREIHDNDMHERGLGNLVLAGRV